MIGYRRGGPWANFPVQGNEAGSMPIVPKSSRAPTGAAAPAVAVGGVAAVAAAVAVVVARRDPLGRRAVQARLAEEGAAGAENEPAPRLEAAAAGAVVGRPASEPVALQAAAHPGGNGAVVTPCRLGPLLAAPLLGDRPRVEVSQHHRFLRGDRGWRGHQ